MNFGASHLVQTSALLRKDSKRLSSGVLTVHAAPKNLLEGCHLDFHNSPRSEASRNAWEGDFETLKPVPSVLERAQFRQYEAAAENIIQQLREILEMTTEELRRRKELKANFERFQAAFEGTANGKRLSFCILKDVIESILGTLFVQGLRTATPDFREQQAIKLVGAFASLKKERELLIT